MAIFQTAAVNGLNIKFMYTYPGTFYQLKQCGETQAVLKEGNSSGLTLEACQAFSSSHSHFYSFLFWKNNIAMIIYNKKGGAGRDQGEKVDRKK